MSHIHVPDGIMSPIWGLIGYLITGLIMYFIFKKVKGTDLRRKIPMTGVVAALMLIGMSVPLGIVPIHLSLAVLSGIIAGPALGFVAVFVVNFLLAFFGHGGMQIVGLNTLVIGSEVFIGSMLFRLLSRKLTPFKSACIATAIGVVTSLTLMVGIVGTSVGWSEAIPHHHGYNCNHDHHDSENEHHDNENEFHDNEHEHHDHGIADTKYLFFTGWAALIIILLLGITLESAGTALIIKFFSKIRPDITGQNMATIDKS